jgi:hypothetical protein
MVAQRPVASIRGHREAGPGAGDGCGNEACSAQGMSEFRTGRPFLRPL